MATKKTTGSNAVKKTTSTKGNKATSAGVNAPHGSNGNSASHANEEQVRRRAYEIFEAGGRKHGFHEDHWYQAEAELRRRSR